VDHVDTPSASDPATASYRLDRLIRTYGADPTDEWITYGERYLLIEQSVPGTGDYQLSTHQNPELAAAHHDGNIADGWAAVLLVDLETGDEFVAVQTTSWEPAPQSNPNE
jgi:hypothetical protein